MCEFIIPTCVFSVGGLMFFIVVVVIELPNDIPISYAHELLVVVVINCFILTAGY